MVSFCCTAHFCDFSIKALQLDCPSGGHCDYAVIFAVEVRFQIRDQFWIFQPKLPKNSKRACSLVFAKKVFYGGRGWAQNWPFGVRSIFSESKVYYERKSNTRLRIFEQFEKTMFHNKPSLVRVSAILSSARRLARLP